MEGPREDHRKECVSYVRLTAAFALSRLLEAVERLVSNRALELARN